MMVSFVKRALALLAVVATCDAFVPGMGRTTMAPPARRAQVVTRAGDAPFSDQIYEDFMKVTQMISKRASSGEVLSEQQFADLEVAVERIVNDAWAYEGGRPEGPFVAEQ
eukprot:CAMPEP_0182576324 /NCGR_PEP_ID=MMETSP1324-20130603/33427_1 /TAXON_ID=236786 /ORGANISM="Florenciella sp., Strain RCC1587" /LENGTH=109 /DNA_ID=CAMNT_0024792011 /DNA_START=88 /DNA_END=417 /DNA_ORIENTATION=+